jgi:hypothetical protein
LIRFILETSISIDSIHFLLFRKAKIHFLLRGEYHRIQQIE